MMKIYKRYITAVFAVLLTLTSCEKDFLNRTPGIELDDEKLFSTPMLAARYADDAYNYLINEYVRFNSYRGSTSQASDEAVSGNSERTVTTLNKGTYHDHATSAGLNDIGDVWKRSYMGIAVTTKMLANISKVPQAAIFPADRVKGEMHFIRAFLYFELTKRFGGVPIIDKVYTVEDNVNLPRNTYQECLNFMLADIEAAIPLLGTDYGPAHYGRATKAAAQALKARVLLYAASKLNNPTGDKQKWKAAADAAKELMEGKYGAFSLQADYATLLNVPESEEYIMIKIRGNRPIDGMFKDYSMSPSAGGQQGQMNPTQNHVDMYEMKATGKLPKEAGSGYDPQNPYAGRDPRFYANILYNGASWQGGKIETWSQTTGDVTNYGKDAGSDIKYTSTSYYCKKYWPEVYKLNGGSQTILNYVFFRYAEILLNYAEAQNEYLDAPDASVYNAVNEIRRRASVQMPDLPAGLDKDKMRVAIRHERAIELAFEDHRWYDIMRWQIGVETIQTPMYGMGVVKNANGTFTYTPYVLADNFQKLFGNHQHRYPIPKSEVQKSNGILIQNEGWEN